ncbi:hypothetical protein [Nostoc sp.]|uniref:hypothetical protein n=1 Tax=Nostoc sp. TaxID=1180 RepID=UPI002FF4AA56
MTPRVGVKERRSRTLPQGRRRIARRRHRLYYVLIEKYKEFLSGSWLSEVQEPHP